MQAQGCLDAPPLIPPPAVLQTGDDVGLAGRKMAVTPCVVETGRGSDGRTDCWLGASPQAVVRKGNVCESVRQRWRLRRPQDGGEPGP